MLAWPPRLPVLICQCLAILFSLLAGPIGEQTLRFPLSTARFQNGGLMSEFSILLSRPLTNNVLVWSLVLWQRFTTLDATPIKFRSTSIHGVVKHSAISTLNPSLAMDRS